MASAKQAPETTAKSDDHQPVGELVVKTIAMPKDTNPNGDIFGGWLLSQMDLGGALLAKVRSKSRVATVALDSMVFYHPVAVGDVVCVYGDLVKVGRTSMRIQVDAWVMDKSHKTMERVTEGAFTYVAITDEGKPHPVDRD